MSGGKEPRNVRLLCALALLAALVACTLAYLPTLDGGFLSDDYSVLGALYAWAGEQRLVATLLAKFGQGLDAPSHYYRPLPMMSFAANYVLAGAHPLPWRLTNLGIHLASGALVFAIAMRLRESDATQRPIIGPMFAAAVFLAFPTNIEAVAWVSGRYDLLALTFMLATVACFQRSQSWRDGWGIAGLVAAACALASKESAALLPVFVLAVAVSRRWSEGSASALALGIRDATPWLILGAAYFALRTAIFGTPFRVYPGTSPVEALFGGDWLRPLASSGPWLAAAMPGPVARIAFLAALVALIGTGALVRSDRPRLRGSWLAIAFTAAMSLILLLPHVASLAPNGEQGRLFYTTSALLALLVAWPWLSRTGAGSRLRHAWRLVVTVVLLVSEIALLRAALESWIDAGRQATALVAALPRAAQTIPRGGYGLVLVPDHLGNVPFGRNAQGGLVSPPVQSETLSNRLLVQTPVDLPQWPTHIARGLVEALQRYPLSEVWTAVGERRATGSLAPTHHFCWAAGAREIELLRWPADPAGDDWLAAWRNALGESRCDASARELAAL